MRILAIIAVVFVVWFIEFLWAVLWSGLHSGLHRNNRFVVKQCRLIIYLINLIC